MCLLRLAWWLALLVGLFLMALGVVQTVGQKGSVSVKPPPSPIRYVSVSPCDATGVQYGARPAVCLPQRKECGVGFALSTSLPTSENADRHVPLWHTRTGQSPCRPPIAHDTGSAMRVP